jgi:hypothetical protein
MWARQGEVLIVLGVAGVAVVLSQALFAPPFPSARPPSRPPTPSVLAPGATTPSVPSPSLPTPSGATPSAQSARHTNEAAGYSFLRPAGWEVSGSGTVSRITSPDRDVTVSFGLGSDGGLRGSSADLTASIQDIYHGAELLEGPRRDTIAGHPAMLVGGRAVNDSRVTVRFLAITLRVGDENYAISVFVSDAADPVTVLPAVEYIVASVEVA